MILKVFSFFGVYLSAYIVLIVWCLILFNLNITWTCGSCGKLNKTNFLKFALQWCNHFGDF